MRHLSSALVMLCKGFNPRIRKGCDIFKPNVREAHVGFNPRIRKGCDCAEEPREPFGPVSIHASVKDATISMYSPVGIIFVSIHASVKDATLTPQNRFQLNPGFNPRIRKGCDTVVVRCSRPV